MYKISELRSDHESVNIVGTVSAIDTPREINTRFGTKVERLIVTLRDASGEIKLNLWGKQAEGILIGKKIEIHDGFVSGSRMEKCLGLTRNGWIEILE